VGPAAGLLVIFFILILIAPWVHEAMMMKMTMMTKSPPRPENAPFLRDHSSPS
jgi:hypothetical protein